MVLSNFRQNNAGMTKTCSACGSSQPKNLQFGLGQKHASIPDTQKNGAAANGADIYCSFCDTRYSAGTPTCKQCGGELKNVPKLEGGMGIGRARTGTNAGDSLAAEQSPPALVPAAKKTFVFRPWMALPIIGFLSMACLVVGFIFFRPTDLLGVVQDVSWQRTIAIEAQRQVTSEGWQNQLPNGATVLSCQQKYRSRQNSPVQGSREVCSTELVDQTNGSVKVVESCFYDVYDNYCKYQALEWREIGQSQSQGTDLNLYWPPANLVDGQREGARTEVYTVIFKTRDDLKKFTTSDEVLFTQFLPGTQWILSVNTMGAIIDVSP